MKSNPESPDGVESVFCRIADGLCGALSWVRGEGDGAAVWKFDGEFAPHADLTGDMSLASVREREVFDDGESEAGAAGFARARFVDAVETLEDARQVFGRNAGAGVAHPDHLTILRGLGEHGDGAARAVEFDRVVHEVDQNLV